MRIVCPSSTSEALLGLHSAPPRTVSVLCLCRLEFLTGYPILPDHSQGTACRTQAAKQRPLSRTEEATSRGFAKEIREEKEDAEPANGHQ